jgi:two-component system sensor histidine kinase KdpD
VGKPQRGRWRELFRSSVVDQLVHQGGNIDVYVIGARSEPVKREIMPAKRSYRSWWYYLEGLGLVVIATFIGELARPFLAPTNLLMLYLLSVVISAVYFGFGPSILVSVLSVLAFDFFFISPFLSFNVADIQYFFTLIVLLGVGIVVSYLAMQVRRQLAASRRREAETAILYALSRDMAANPGLEAMIRVVISNVKQTFGNNVAVFLPDPQNEGSLKPYVEKPKFAITQNDVAIATWAFQHQQAAGHGTDTIPNAKARYLPLNVTKGPVGVMGVWLSDAVDPFTDQQLRLLEAVADLAATGIERAQMTKASYDSSPQTRRNRPATNTPPWPG